MFPAIIIGEYSNLKTDNSKKLYFTIILSF